METIMEKKSHEQNIKSNLEMLEIKTMLIEQRNILEKFGKIINNLIPEEVSITYVVEQTGKSRQAVRSYLIEHFNYQSDFYKKGSKIFMTRETAAQIIGRRAA